MTAEISILHVQNRAPGAADMVSRFTLERAREALSFHRTVPGYAPTPLRSLPGLAEKLGVRGFWVKDESSRFGLNAFKGLGGSFCVAKLLSERLGAASVLPFPELKAALDCGQIPAQPLITATDGNHGRGIAWIAGLLGLPATVLMPAGSSPERLENIRSLSAFARITDLNYDDTVRLAAKTAEKTGALLVQDTAWPGYERIPDLIMQGYTTMGLEIAEELPEEARPTHVFFQAGVGAMAGAMTGFFASLYGSAKPVITVVEPRAADCVFRTAKAADGELHAVRGALSTLMAGLACGEPCTIGWRELEARAEHFLSITDSVALLGMRQLAKPLAGDPRIVSGESGAAGAGAAIALLSSPELEPVRKALGLGRDAVLLCLSTEGATDRKSFQAITGQTP